MEDGEEDIVVIEDDLDNLTEWIEISELSTDTQEELSEDSPSSSVMIYTALEIKCPYCEIWYRIEDDLLLHILNAHLKGRLFCSICNIRYKSSVWFFKHMKQHCTTRTTIDETQLDEHARKRATLDACESKPIACSVRNIDSQQQCNETKTKKGKHDKSNTIQLPDPSLWNTPLFLDP
ncbi:hypothetical protein DMENIID0001_076090 [Sergentomyia squamirostris]